MIYLDNAATTRVRPEAAQAALDVMTQGYGNPSSRYPLGRQAAQRMEEDRAQVAQALGCQPEEVVFTSCGTEGDNWAVRASAELGRRVGKHIVTTAIEHSAVTNPIRALEQQGWDVTWLQPNADGTVEAGAVEAALRPDTALVSMMLVNNELGSILPVAEAARAVRRLSPQALIHTDAVQAFLKVPFTPAELGVDFLAVSGHKIGAPKGIGALYVRRALKSRVKPLLLGGGQEGGLRPGTEPTAQIAALAAACRAGLACRAESIARMGRLKEYTLELLAQKAPDIRRVGRGQAPHILSLTLPGYQSEVLVRFLADRGICISSGSACHKGKASDVFQAMPLSRGERMGAFRVSFCPDSAEEEVQALADALAAAREELLPSLS